MQVSCPTLDLFYNRTASFHARPRSTMLFMYSVCVCMCGVCVCVCVCCVCVCVWCVCVRARAVQQTRTLCKWMHT